MFLDILDKYYYFFTYLYVFLLDASCICKGRRKERGEVQLKKILYNLWFTDDENNQLSNNTKIFTAIVAQRHSVVNVMIVGSMPTRGMNYFHFLALVRIVSFACR